MARANTTHGRQDTRVHVWDVGVVDARALCYAVTVMVELLEETEDPIDCRLCAAREEK